MVEGRKYPFLDGFRGLGILMIVIHHMCVGFNLYNLFKNDPPVLSWILFKTWQWFKVDLSLFYLGIESLINSFKGILGVQVFFLISGFLITRTLIKQPLALTDVRRFLLRRLFRIYPIYVCMIIASLCFYALHVEFNAKELAAILSQHLLFLQNYFPRHFIFEHTWTLAIFEQFYVAAALIIFVVGKCAPQPIQMKSILLSICVGLLILGGWIKYNYLIHGKVFMNGPLQSPVPYFTITYHLGSLSFGCLLALIAPHVRRIPKSKALGAFAWVYGVWMYYFLFFEKDWGYHWGEWYLNIFGYTASAALMYAAYHGVSFLARLKFFQAIGRMAYGIYIWHILILICWGKYLGSLPPTLTIAGYLVVVFGVGWISSRTIELYFLRLRERF